MADICHGQPLIRKSKRYHLGLNPFLQLCLLKNFRDPKNIMILICASWTTNLERVFLVERRMAEHKMKHPEERIISLGVSETSKPLPEFITSAMAMKSLTLSTLDGNSVYGARRVEEQLRAEIASKIYGDLGIENDDIFISDGTLCDISRLQAYVDLGVIMGQSGEFQSDLKKFKNIKYMKCTPENDFFADLSTISPADLIFYCSPNNPTGAAATKEQLMGLVQFAKDNGSIIIHDATYSMYISDDSPRSIFEIPGAKEVAIETSSFSKTAGFSRIRLGWTVVPKELLYSDGFPIAKDFKRISNTCFSGASIIAQVGGLACLSPKGWKATQDIIQSYKNNTKLIVDTFNSLGFKVYGGKNAPFVWVQFPGRSSWDVFDEILEKIHVSVTPGSGFGPTGEGFIRVAALNQEADVLEACERFKQLFKSTRAYN
ncbi:probable LL-diaminopimelate aminotransferase, chloroplastic isoform X2 [Malania oleifera]|uniref:probable LL-diaminopimelate aminotransferase, chloroplastic isoform X2 n=1 Tax=Malania oleifera TaxID=397392 RepID=UPI0025AE1DAF|nr:probable LL-diaminopimelate aminotransferase, chloroplastic isoform X2 [Malania oleifera]